MLPKASKLAKMGVISWGKTRGFPILEHYGGKTYETIYENDIEHQWR